MNNQANNNLQNETKELLQDNEASKGKSEYFTDPIVNEIGGTIENVTSRQLSLREFL